MITGGKVTFGRVVQPAQYETKRAEVEILFSLPEGVGADAAQDQLNKAADMAQAKALELVGLKRAEKPAEPVKTEKPAETKPVKAEKAPEPEKPTRTKADIEAEKKAELAAKEAAATKPAADPAAVVDDPAAVVEPAQNISVNPEDRKDPAAVDDDLFTADPAPIITDADLRTKITDKQAKIKNGPAIRGLIGKYVKPGQGANDIPADKRQAFLVELEAL